MGMDFTMGKYEQLCRSWIKAGYSSITVLEYFQNKPGCPTIILRHDVDKRSENALEMAAMEKSMGQKSTYYFRTTEDVFNPQIMKSIQDMGHEVGFHYEVLVRCDGDCSAAVDMFKKELERFKDAGIPVKTCAMHGSPLSPIDDRDLWKETKPSNLGLVGDAYLSIDYDKVAYFTDTGRSWGSHRSAIKDRVETKLKLPKIKTTDQLIELIESKEYSKLCILAHPQRWSLGKGQWAKELLGQGIKNIGKTAIRTKRDKGGS